MNTSTKTVKKGSASNSQNRTSNSPTVHDITGFLRHINKITKSDTTKGSRFLFRGQECAKWSIQSSAYRRLKKAAGNKEVPEKFEINYNLELIQEFKLWDFHSSNSSEVMKLDLGVLAQLQHNGAATSLIDFSDSPLIALWFACKKSPEGNNNGKVFILSTGDESKFEKIDSFERLKNPLVKFSETSEIPTIRLDENLEDVIKKLDPPKMNSLLNNKKIYYWKPAHLNNRITAQQSYFVIGKREIPEIQKIVITENSKSNILKELSSVYGIDEATLFPDLVGFAQARSVYSPYGKEGKWLINKTIVPHGNEISPKNSQDYISGGLAKYHLGNYHGAINDFTQAINIDPNNADAYNNRGNAKKGMKEYQGAIDDYTKAIMINPKDANTYNNRGTAKNNLKDYQGAINDYTESIKINPNNGDTYYSRGFMKFILQDYAGAISDYNQSIKINPNNAELYNSLGIIMARSKDYKAAIDNYNQAINLNPKDANGYYNRAYIKSVLQKYEDAIDDYKIALKFSTNEYVTNIINKAIKEAKEKLKGLQSKPPKNKR